MSKKTKKVDPLVEAGVTHIDYKDTALLKQYLTKFNRIIPRYYSGVSLANQKKLAQAIKRARYMALLPYVLNVRGSHHASVATTEANPVLDEASVSL